MKKIYSLAIVLTLMLGFTVKADTWLVEVEDFEFDPQTLNVSVGDTILWVWDEGFHTTTSTSVPAGAASWDQTISSTSPMYMYVVTQPGLYQYHCVPHSSMGMTANFIASGSVGIEQLSAPVLSMESNLVSTSLQITYSLQKSASTSLDIYDLTGKVVRTLNEGIKNAGSYTQNLFVGDLPKGIYIINLHANDAVVSRKITLQ